MEEIAHIYLNHVPSRLVLIADNIQVRDFEKAQEHEAYGVGAAALLPWGSFFPQVNSGYTIRRLAEEFDVTPDLIQYRIKITAAYRLYRARQLGRVQAKVSRR